MTSREQRLFVRRTLIVVLVLLAVGIGQLWFASFLSPPTASGDDSDSNAECLETSLGYCSETALSVEGEGATASGYIGYSGDQEVPQRCLLPGTPCTATDDPEVAGQSSGAWLPAALKMQ